MKKFTSVNSIASYIDIVNIDTDMIIPKQFLKTIKRVGLGKFLFYEMRYDKNNKEIKDFILNQDDYKNSQILISRDNFGCGSSREHAPWSLYDFGIRVVIAPSFADIFYNNSFKNSILLIKLDNNKIDNLINIAKSKKKIKIDLEKQEIILDENKRYNFDIDPNKKENLLNGYDDINLTLKNEDLILKYEEKMKSQKKWLFS